MPLYESAIPNATAAPDEEKQGSLFGWAMAEKVSRPTITAYLPAPDKSVGSSVIIFPGGGYAMEGLAIESTTIAELLQNRGVAAFVVKYRLPSDVTMVDKSIGPLQDAQQSIRLVREHALEWNIDPSKVGVMGFSAGGHLASTAGTHFSKAYVPNDDNVNLRPDFMVLVYPVISMMNGLTHQGSRDALLGTNPADTLVRLFSNEQQVTDETPPTLLLHAADDTIVDVDNSVDFFEALRHHKVPVEMIIFPKGDHGFLLITRDEWIQPMFVWMTRNAWMKP
jgi:acetyl esterase/lipase